MSYVVEGMMMHVDPILNFRMKCDFRARSFYLEMSNLRLIVISIIGA